MTKHFVILLIDAYDFDNYVCHNKNEDIPRNLIWDKNNCEDTGHCEYNDDNCVCHNKNEDIPRNLIWDKTIVKPLTL